MAFQILQNIGITREEDEDLARARRARARKRKREPRLPRRIIPIPNADKKFHEKWYPGRDLLDIPHPSRIILASKPNGGKTTVIKNIIARVNQGRTPFEKIVVVHCDPDATLEYRDLDKVRLLKEIPAVEDFDEKLKTLVILEDLNYLAMGSAAKGRMERLFGYASTHKNISVMLTAQDPFRIMATARRCANVFVIWNNHDQPMIRTLAQRTGVNPKVLTDLFRHKCPTIHDSLWMDLTPNTPAPFRKNGYEVFHMNPLGEETVQPTCPMPRPHKKPRAGEKIILLE